jgi:uncharacterized protein DUF4255
VLDVALKFLVKELNTYLLARTGDTFGEVQLGRLVDDGGKWTVKEDHLAAALINVEEERTFKSQTREVAFVDGRHVVLEPNLKLNLHVMFAAYFQQHDVALKYLSLVLTYFQSHPTFPRDSYPGLDPRIERVSADLQSLSFEQLNQVWAFIGGKQLPSLVYRVRMIVLQDGEPADLRPPITTIGTEVLVR